MTFTQRELAAVAGHAMTVTRLHDATDGEDCHSRKAWCAKHHVSFRIDCECGWTKPSNTKPGLEGHIRSHQAENGKETREINEGE